VRDENGSARIVVADDGKGFDPERSVEGFGLFAIRERLDPIEGQLEVDSAPGRGTRAIVTIPHCGL
jgi:signal transduction histidine kinase